MPCSIGAEALADIVTLQAKRYGKYNYVIGQWSRAPQFQPGESGVGESFFDGGDDGEESDDDTLVRDRLAQVFSQAPGIFNR